jgi:methanol--5-hydroxybenzimidazolylcobamide Co-methyltransferase
MNCNIRDVVFSLAVLGVNDMRFLWRKIVDIAAATGRIAGGDTACGFGNTAMVLAEQKYIPRVFAAVVRVVTIVRTLVALEEGAVGPDKDCG